MPWEWLPSFLDRYQCLCGELRLAARVPDADLIEAFVGAVPAAAGPVEQLLILLLLKDFAARASLAWSPRDGVSLRRAGLGDLLTSFRAALLERVHTQQTLDPALMRDRRLRSIVAFINEHYGEAGLSVAAAASCAGLSTSHFVRLLKQETGWSFSRYVRELRVVEAKRLLERTTRSVKEIAAAVGYARTDQLDWNFKRRFGVLPTEIRRRGTG